MLPNSAGRLLRLLSVRAGGRVSVRGGLSLIWSTPHLKLLGVRFAGTTGQCSAEAMVYVVIRSPLHAALRAVWPVGQWSL